MFKHLSLLTALMILVSSVSHAMFGEEEEAGGNNGKSLHSPRGGGSGGKEDSSGDGGSEKVARADTFPQFNKLEADLKGQISGFLDPPQRAHLAGMSRGDRDAMHLTEKEYLSAYLKRGERPGEAIASPMSYLTELMGMREQTTVFGPDNGYLHHTACLARTLVMEMALTTTLTGKLTVASIKGGLYKTLVDVARVRPGLVQRSFIDLLPTAFEGGTTAFLPGLHHKYASYRVFGTAPQVAAFQIHMNGHLSVLQESIALEYTSLEEAHINTNATYIVLRQDRLAENMAVLDACFSANQEKTLLIEALNQTLLLGKEEVPESVLHLSFSNTQHNLTTIGSQFLSQCTGLRALDLSPLSKVKTVGDSFLSWCHSLTVVDLTPLSTVTTVGGHFLSGCTYLTAVDLTPLSNLTTVAYGFLFGCSGLTAVDLAPLADVTTVGKNFLSYCTGLRALDLSPLVNITATDDYFLYGYIGDTPIDPHGLIKAL